MHPVCSHSAGLISTDFLQKFLQGNRSLLSRWLHRLSGSVSVLRFCQEPPAPASLGYICWSWACFLLPSVATPTKGTGSVGFPHSANFTPTFFCRPRPLWPSCSASSFYLYDDSLLISLSPTWSNPLASLACVHHVCWQPARCAGVPLITQHHTNLSPLLLMHTCTGLSSHSETVMSVLMNSFRVSKLIHMPSTGICQCLLKC